MILTILDSTGTTQGPNERRRYLQIGLLGLALLLVAVLGFRQVQRWMTPQQEVWVASIDLPVGAVVEGASVRKAKLAESSLPKGALLDARAIAGRVLARPKQEGQPFTKDDFQTTAAEATAIAELVPEGRVLATIRVPMTLVPYKNLKHGDRLDVVQIDKNGANGTIARVVAADAFLVATMYAPTAAQRAPARSGLAALIPPPLNRSRGPSTVGLVLALHPEHALPLAQATSGREQVQVVVHGQAEVASGQLLELPSNEPVEFIAGVNKSQLVVTP